MKIQALVVSCDEFQYACIIKICCQSTEPVFNCLLHFFIATHVCAAQKPLQVCESVPGPDYREDGKKRPKQKSLCTCYAHTIFTFWMTLVIKNHVMKMYGEVEVQLHHS
jgi:hypothetical protein